jgi:serine/threonine-protein kinase RsbW/stage II sporulation protein AB (anti-sigma F factor)
MGMITKPQHSEAVSRGFAATVHTVAEARRFVTHWLLTRLPGDDVLIGDVALAVSEACTNVVIHAYRDREPGWFHVTVEVDGGAVHVGVTDDGCGVSPRPDSPGIGLGMPLMASVTEALHVLPGEDGSGTVVAMRFRPAGTPAPAISV